TPTAKVAVPLATERKTLFFGAFTGAGFLSDVSIIPYSFSLRASYNAEIENMMRRLKEDLGIKKVGLFVQRDAFGLAGIQGAVRAEQLVEGIKLVPPVPEIPDAESSVDDWNKFWSTVPHYKRNTVSVGGGVRQVRGNGVEAVILVGSSRPCALAINQWHKMGFNVPMINISFVGSNALAQRLKDSQNVYISQVVPDPWNPSIPLIKEYQQDLGNDDYGFVSLEGYLTAKVMHQGLKTITGGVTSDSIKKSLESMTKYDAGGVQVSFGPDDHRGMDTVYLTHIEKSDDAIRFIYVDKLLKSEQK
ncbi:MAG: hypothetical protein D3923_17280, partial [Candidatus Electrothrix sp. AR3]|nr:hypothetical protein [Candidatus Electrothrix sp. AR3]